MNHKTQYRLSEQAAQNRLAEFQSDAEPSDLTRELGLARQLLETAITQGQSVTAKDLLSLIASLSKAQEASLLRKGALFSAERAHRMLDSMGSVMAEVLLRELPDRWEDLCDEVADTWAERLLAERERARQDTGMRQRLGKLPGPGSSDIWSA